MHQLISQTLPRIAIRDSAGLVCRGSQPRGVVHSPAMSTRLALSSHLRTAPSRFRAHLARHPWVWILSGGYVLTLFIMLPAVSEVRGRLAIATLALAAVFLSLGLGLALALGLAGAHASAAVQRTKERRVRCIAATLALLGLPAATFGIMLPLAAPPATSARIAAAFPVAMACAHGRGSRTASLADIPPAVAQSLCHSLSQRTVQVEAALHAVERRRPLHRHIQVLVSPSLSANAETWELSTRSFLIEVDSSTVSWLDAASLAAIVGHEMGHVAASRTAAKQARAGWWVLAVLAAAGWLSLLACFAHTRRTRPRKAAPLLAGACLAMAMAALGLCAGVATLQRKAEYAADQWGASVTSPHRMALALALLSSSSGQDGIDATTPFSDHPALAARVHALGVDVDSVRSEASHYFQPTPVRHRPRSAPLLQSPAS